MKRLVLLALWCSTLSGCVYFNSMYNARKLTSQAEKAEREGRTLDAATYWGQVAVKAETLLARHPESDYVPEAQILRGQAYSHLRDCSRARPALLAGIGAAEDSALTRLALLTLARCEASLKSPRLALSAYERFLAGGEVPDSIMAEYSEALRRAGFPDSAATVMSGVEGEFLMQRLRVLAAAGDTAQIDSLVRVLHSRTDTAQGWDSVAALLARHDPVAASHLLDAIGDLPGMETRARANALLADGRRLAATDRERAAERFAEAARLDSLEVAPVARFAALRLELDSVDSRAALAGLLERSARDSANVYVGGDVQAFRRAALGVLDGTDPSDTSSTRDLRWFLSAEAARDQLRAPRLAQVLFRAFPDQFPNSPYTPKALLAALFLAPGDSVASAMLGSTYSSSPYVLASLGLTAQGLAALEDSLGAFTATRASSDSSRTRRPARPGQQPGARPAGVELP